MTPDDSIRDLARKTAKAIVDHGSIPMATLKESIILQDKVDALLSKEIEFPEVQPFPEIPEINLTPIEEKLDELLVETKKKDLLEYDLQIDEKTRQKLKGDKGDKGKDGHDGKDGRDGVDGVDGKDGKNGKDAVLGDIKISDVKELPETIATLQNRTQLLNQMVTSRANSASSSGSSTFTGLTDTPSSYTGQGTKFVRVNAGESALEFATIAGGGDALTSAPLSQFAATTSLQLKGVISDETGSGALVFANSPALITPTGIVKSDVGLGNVANLDTSTTANITDSTNKRFVTDAQQTVISNTSGTNTGDNAVNSLYSGLVSNATHTGDATGSTALTLATVNANVGSFGSATQVAGFTVNAKGLVTAASNTSIQIAESQVTNLTTDLAGKEASITGTTSADFWSGAKTFVNFASTVRSTVLTGLSLVSTTVISATDTVLVALGSLQAQITALTTTVSGKTSSSTTISTTAPLSGGGDLSANRTITTSMATNKLIGRGTAGTGVFEEITLGTNLSLSGTTLNATGGGGAITTQDEGSTLSTTVTTLNFTGAGVTASGSGATTTINIPGGSSSFAVTSAEIDFGSVPVKSKRITVTDAAITTSSKIMVTPNGATATGRVGNDWEWDTISFSAVPGTGNFVLTGTANGRIVGKRNIFYTYS